MAPVSAAVAGISDNSGGEEPAGNYVTVLEPLEPLASQARKPIPDDYLDPVMVTFALFGPFAGVDADVDISLQEGTSVWRMVPAMPAWAEDRRPSVAARL